MATKNSILADLTHRFATLGKELGFSEPIVQNHHGWETHIFMIRNGHALQMEILWYDLAVLVYAVRLIDGKIPEGYIEHTAPDGSCRKISVNRIYNIAPKKRKKIQHASLTTWDKMEPYYYDSLGELDLIRNDPGVLLRFMDGFDSAPRRRKWWFLGGRK